MLELLRRRRSIRKFQPRPVAAETQQQLIEAVLRSPSSRGRNPWEFIVVDDTALLTKLAACKRHGSAFLAAAPLAVVVAADPRKSDVWIEDCAIAAIILQLTAASLGLGSCWAQIRLRDHDDNISAEDYIRRLLGLPEELRVEAVVGIGYPAEEKPGHSSTSLLSGQVHHNFFGTGR